MNIRELLYEANQYKHESLVFLIEFLLIEKGVVKLEDDISVMDRYFLPKHSDRMDKLLKEYIQKRGK